MAKTPLPEKPLPAVARTSATPEASPRPTRAAPVTHPADRDLVWAFLTTFRLSAALLLVGVWA
ncbi:MAG: hypothetical protein KF729_02260 [Sandaracinaceae bacterium]|nr:hypothetical protein [Sandaracinaceae bacterium]